MTEAIIPLVSLIALEVAMAFAFLVDIIQMKTTPKSQAPGDH